MLSRHSCGLFLYHEKTKARMYGITLTFDILTIVDQAQAPLTISDICSQIAANIPAYQQTPLRARVLRRIHCLNQLQKIKIEYRQTKIKTEYILISKP
jgi:hypothetical protein